MPGPQRVLILHDYGGARGGAEHVALDFRRLLTERGIDARLLTSTADGWAPDQAPDYACAGGHDVWRPLREAWNPSAARALKHALSAFRPDVVQIVMFLTQLSPSILPVLAGTPTVYSLNTYRPVCPTGLRWRPDTGLCRAPVGAVCHRSGCVSVSGLAARRLQLGLLTRSEGMLDRIVAPSLAMRDLVAEQGWRCTDVIPHAVPPHVRRVPMGDRPMVAFSGRLVPEKGVEWLIRSFARIADAVPGARLVVIGDGPERARLEAVASETCGPDRVGFTGHVTRDRSQRILEECWVQVVPSLWAEPFGLVAAEALARGTPVIASDAGGPREIVEDGATGWIVRTGDVEALATALDTALRDRRTCERMGAAGVSVAATRYDQGRWIDAHLSIYEELITAGRAKGGSGTARRHGRRGAPGSGTARDGR